MRTPSPFRLRLASVCNSPQPCVSSSPRLFPLHPSYTISVVTCSRSSVSSACGQLAFHYAFIIRYYNNNNRISLRSVIPSQWTNVPSEHLHLYKITISRTFLINAWMTVLYRILQPLSSLSGPVRPSIQTLPSFLHIYFLWEATFRIHKWQLMLS